MQRVPLALLILTSAASLGADAPRSFVTVAESVPLAHTTQYVGKGPNASAQAARVLDQLDEALKQAGSALDRAVKVNVYAVDVDALSAFRATLARRWNGRPWPAVCEVIGALEDGDAKVAADAVATAEPGSKARQSNVAILPTGGRIYISGQADPGADLAEATRKTLLGLNDTLTHLGLDRSRVVQAKAFLQPISGAADVRREMAAFFGGAEQTPPVVLVEWRMPQPIEIEWIVAAPGTASGETVEYSATPKLKASPVFSRVAKVNRGPLIYLSAFRGAAAESGTKQVATIFDSLGRVLNEAGSDFQHLVKATYYVSSDEASKALNEIRPHFYNPNRPPAASKASVRAVGAEGLSVTLDMIAVPAN